MSAPEQDELREALRRAADASGSRELDLDAVLDASRLARRRRRNGILGGTAAVAALIATAGLVGGLAGLTGPAVTTADAPVTGAQELAPQTEGQESAVAPRDEVEHGDVALGRLAAVSRCGDPIVAATDASSGPLHLTVRPIGQIAAGSTGDAVLTLTNTGAAAVEGELRTAPSVAVADVAGTVVALRPDADQSAAGEAVDLSPGESMELSAAIEAVRCTAGRAPTALPAGDYLLAATVVVVPDDAEQAALTAVSPLVPLVVE